MMREGGRSILDARLRFDDHSVERSLCGVSRQGRYVLCRRQARIFERLLELGLDV